MHAAGTGAERSDSAMQVAMRPLPDEKWNKYGFCVDSQLLVIVLDFRSEYCMGLPMINPVTTPYHIVAYKTYKIYIIIIIATIFTLCHSF